MTIRHALTAAAGNTSPATPTDPQFNYVSMLLHGDGTNGAQNNTFVSTPITAPASGYFAGYFDGNGDYVSVGTNTAFAFGTGDFTLEAWVYDVGTTAAYALIVGSTNFGVATNTQIYYDGSTRKFTYYGQTGNNVTSSAAISRGTWNHVAAVRSGTTVTIYVNGTASGTVTETANITSTINTTVGAAANANSNTFFFGYISNVRIVKGTAVYTANFTPPTVPLTAISGTSLLTCMSGTGVTFADLSTNNFTITANGNATMTGVATTPPGAVPYAGYFDGSGDYASVADNVALQLGSGDFTIEHWINASSISGTAIISCRHSNSTGSWIIFRNGANLQFYCSSTGGTWDICNGVAIGTVTANSWNHVAVSRSGTSIRCFLNGVIGSTTTSSATLYVGSIPTVLGGNNGGFDYYAGYISNFRIVKGTAVYTSNFAPPNSPLTAISGTSLLTCQSATFIDNSPNAFTITVNGNTTVTSSYILPSITRNGNTTQGSLSPYGNLWSNYFDGSGDYLTVGGGMPSGQGTEFTLEFWAYAISVKEHTFTQGASGGTLDFYVNSSGAVKLDNTGIAAIASSANNAFPYNTWVHIALTRTTGNVYTIYINGVSVATGTNSTSMTANTTIGQHRSTGASYFFGYMSNWRVTNTRVYTSNFTPPTAPLTAISGTSLLTCQSNRFIDNSANNFTITRNGDVRVTKEAPFLPTAAYSTSTIGGSGYFNGTGNYLTASSVTFAGDFTVEGWVFIANLSGNRALVQIGDGSTSTGPFFYVSTAGKFIVYAAGILITGSATLTANTWVHLAVCRSGSTIKSYVNGVLDATTTNSTTFTGTVRVGAEWYTGTLGSTTMNGYISDLRLVTGTAVYTSNFTPPTAPLTAITNTSLLLNFTNAGIFDNAAENDLETVGNAQISTSVKKYGTGSLAFDGTGDYLAIPQNVNFEFGTGDFTIEGWFYRSSTSGDNCIFALDNVTYPRILIQINSTTLYAYASNTGSSWNILSGLSFGTIASNTWYYFALTRQGATFRAFLNGTLINSATSSAAIGSQRTSASVGLAETGSFANYWNGYIDDLRITKGYARYTSNFTPPTQAFPNQ